MTAWHHTLEEHLKQHLGDSLKILQMNSVSGGSINDAACLHTTKGKFFVKWNQAIRYPGMFEAEQKGLEMLRRSDSLKVPEVVLRSTIGETEFLLLEWIERGEGSSEVWKRAGQGLRALHTLEDNSFGLDQDNYIGSLPQCNTHRDSWHEFFFDNRLGQQVRLSGDRLPKDVKDGVQQLQTKTENWFDDVRPSLLHGDLWSGNIVVGRDPWLIDPAVYYGYGEADIAMTRLFGGFPMEFYEAYYDKSGIPSDLDTVHDILNLYPLMVHFNLFGVSYLTGIRSTLNYFLS